MAVYFGLNNSLGVNPNFEKPDGEVLDYANVTGLPAVCKAMSGDMFWRIDSELVADGNDVLDAGNYSGGNEWELDFVARLEANDGTLHSWFTQTDATTLTLAGGTAKTRIYVGDDTMASGAYFDATGGEFEFTIWGNDVWGTGNDITLTLGNDTILSYVVPGESHIIDVQ